jgi:hypothetical protein
MFKVTKLELRCRDEIVQGAVAGQPLTISVDYECADPARFAKGLGLSLTLKSDERKLTNLWSAYQNGFTFAPAARGRVDCHLGPWQFREANITTDVYTHDGAEALEWIEGALNFVSHDGDFYGSGRLTNPGEGILFLPHHWTNHARK